MSTVNGSPVSRIPPESSREQFELFILCDPTDGRSVIVTVVIDPLTSLPIVTAYEITGILYVGSLTALVVCADVDVESDGQPFCSGVNTIFRWFVKSNGTPTGVTFDTTLLGVVLATDPLAIPGACVVANTDDCASIPAAFVQSSTCDRPYQDRTSGLVTGAYVVVLTVGSLLRSYTLLVAQGDLVTRTNGPDAGAQFPAGSYSFSAPNNGSGEERGFFPIVPTFTSTGQFMVTWTEG